MNNVSFYRLSLQDELEAIRDDSLDVLTLRLANLGVEARNRIPEDFICSLNETQQILALRMCLLMYHATKGSEIPKLLQLQAALACINRNTLAVAGTSFGKTHIMALVMLLEKSDSERIFITISPLKRLQTTQVTSFLSKYGIRTVSINQESPRDTEYWKNNIHNKRKGASQQGTVQHLIVTAEQLFKSPEGHYTQLALHLHDPSFRKRLLHFNIDEAHFIHYAGLERFGLPAFWPFWVHYM